MGKPKGKHMEYDDSVLRLLQHGPHTPYRVGKYLGVSKDVAAIVLRRLHWQGKVEWRGNHEGARLKKKNATRDTSPFPAPWWPTPKVGLWG